MITAAERDAPLPVGVRHRSRERALALLYEAESKGIRPDEALAALPSQPEAYAATLCAGVAAHQAEIDDAISRHSSGWALSRMPAIDRQVLRLATFELLACPEVPVAVVLDEAVELAKAYSTEESGRFVNGVLAAIAVEVRPGTDGAR